MPGFRYSDCKCISPSPSKTDYTRNNGNEERKHLDSVCAKFNPLGYCTDMAGANIAGKKNVFSELACIKTCEFHFLEEEFILLTDQLLYSKTIPAYESTKAKLDNFIKSNSSCQFLSTWIEWWHVRRGFNFRAFCVQGATRMNQAEVIHARWVHRDRPNLTLLDACQADTRDAVMMETELKKYQFGATTGGKGPSFAEKQKRIQAREVQKPHQIGKEMFEDNSFLIDPTSSHCPPEQRKKKTKGQAKSTGECNNIGKAAATRAIFCLHKRCKFLKSPARGGGYTCDKCWQ